MAGWQDEAMTDGATTEDATTEDATTEDAMTEDAMTEDAMTEDAMTEDATTEDAMTEDAMTDGSTHAEREYRRGMEGLATGVDELPELFGRRVPCGMILRSRNARRRVAGCAPALQATLDAGGDGVAIDGPPGPPFGAGEWRAGWYFDRRRGGQLAVQRLLMASLAVGVDSESGQSYSAGGVRGVH
jgi:pentapeptide MXKDX repeat protein